MSFDLVLSLMDRIGVLVFAISGGIVAVRARMDLLGILVLAFLPALGGGTLRDLILDAPVFWLTDTVSLVMVAAGAALAFLFAERVERFKALRWADAAGLALFAVAGAAKTLDLGHGLAIAVIMGGVTASAGGLLRDVVAGREPLLLKQDVYATAALLGALAFGVASRTGLPFDAAAAIGIAVGFTIRACAIRFGWSLPTGRGGDA